MDWSIGGLAKQWNCQSTLFMALDTNALIRNHKESTKIKRIILSMPVEKSNKLKVVAGKAILRKQGAVPHIKLHAALFDDRDIVSHDRLDTFFHEIAHQVAYLTQHHKGHGFPWAYCMMHFGFEPSRCYDPGKFNYRGYKDRKETREVDSIMDDFMGDFNV